MTEEDRVDSPATKPTARSSEEFAAFCEGELERRRNSGAEFDEEDFRQAKDLALTKLRFVEEGA